MTFFFPFPKTRCPWSGELESVKKVEKYEMVLNKEQCGVVRGDETVRR